MLEIWKPAVKFENHYEVSNLGNVRRKGQSKFLAKVIDKDGYVSHCFCIKQHRTNVMAHKLVAEAFIRLPNSGEVVRHFDGNSKNNIVSNLLYGTPLENSADMARHGTQPRGITAGRAKLTENDVLQIRMLTGTQRELAKKFNIGRVSIHNIIHRKTWKHI